MANATVRVPPDSSGKRIDTSQISIFGDVVQRQRVVLSDPEIAGATVTVENGALNVAVQSGLELGRSNGGPSVRAGTDSYVQMPVDSTGKKLDMSAITVGADTVNRQRIILADSNDPTGLVTVTGGCLNVNIVRLGGNFISTLTPNDGDVLTYDAVAGRWVARAPVAVTPPVVVPPPSISSISPTTGPLAGGTVVTITGADFALGANVTFGGIPATSVVVVSTTSITATSPPRSTAGGVTIVVTVGGQSGNLLNAFTYQAPPAPTVTNVTPNSGTTAGGTNVTIVGTNFASGATVAFDGSAATNVSVTSTTTLTCTTPARAAGAVTVAVTVSGQTGSLPTAFTYVVPAPTVSGISPTSGSTAGGLNVTITGTNFQSGATVTIGGVAATNVTVASSTSITCTTPAGTAGAQPVVVTVGVQTAQTTFTYVTPPTVSSISPNSGWANATTAVTITGNNFVSGATVTFGGTAATGVTVVNATTITCTAPSRAAGAVNVVVTVSGQAGTLTSGFTYNAAAVGVYVGIGGPGAAASPITLSGTQITLSNGVVLNQAKATAEAPNDVFPSASTWFTPNDECIYLLMNNGSLPFFDQSGNAFAFQPPIAVTITGKTMYLYRSQMQLETFGNGWRVRVGEW